MFQTEVKINFFDCDPAGIMFFGNIFKLAHSAYEELLRKGSLKKDYFLDTDYAVPLIHSEADFLKPIMPGEVVLVRLNVSVIKESSFELNYEILNGKKEICAKVKTVHVVVNKTTWQKTSIPEELKSCLSNA